MADDDDRVVEVGQEVLKPVDALKVEVVGRLVQKQDVRVSEEGLSQKDADLEVVLDLLHLLLVEACRDAKAVEHLGSLALGFPAAHLGELALKLGGADAVLLAEVRLRVDLITLLHDAVELVIAHDDGLEDTVLVEGEVVLPEDRHPLARRDDDLSAVGLDLSREDLHEGRLARTVGTDDAIAVAGRELYVDVLEEDLGSVRKRNVAGCDHAVVLSRKKLQHKAGTLCCSSLVPRGIEPLFRD